MSPTPAKTAATRRGYGGRSAEELQAERRERLLAAAMELFGTRGYLATRIEHLCGEARVTTRHFYEQFSDREALLTAVFERVMADAATAVLGALAQDGQSGMERARAGLHAFVHLQLNDPRRARISCIEVMGVSRALEDRRREVMQRFASLIESQLQQLAAQGLVPQRSYRALALAFVGGVHELEIDWLLAQPHPAVDSVVDELWFILSTLLAGSQALMHQPG